MNAIVENNTATLLKLDERISNLERELRDLSYPLEQEIKTLRTERKRLHMSSARAIKKDNKAKKDWDFKVSSFLKDNT